MSVLPNRELFVPHVADGPRTTEYMQDADVASDDVSRATLSAKIGKMGSDLIMDEFGCLRAEYDKKVSLEKWLAKQKLRIPLDSRHTYSGGNGPITHEIVCEYLDMWNFNSSAIEVHIKKREYLGPRYGCYVLVTFTRK